ncbi:MAG: hypothetical protein ACRDNT_00070 [Streptosporangiaceae bacterium]
MPARRPDGPALRGWRQSRNWDQTGAAHRLRAAAAANGDTTATLNSLVKMIYAWERGAYTITERYALLYAAALGVPVGELAGGPPRQLTAIVPAPGPELPPGPLTNRDVEVIRGMLDSLTASDRQFGGNRTLEYATDYLRGIILPRLSAVGPELVIRDLHAVACEFTLRLASMYADAGHPRESRRMLGASFPLAEETGDPSWTAWVLARRGEQHLDDDDPVQAVAYTSAAVAMAASAPSRARGFITSKYALALAARGDRTGAERVLGEARDAWNAAGEIAEPAWMRSYGIAHATHDEARARLRLGQGRLALPVAEASLAARSQARPRGFALAVIVFAALQDRDPQRACAAARDLLTIAGSGDSQRLAPQVTAVLRALMPYRRLPEAQDIFDIARAAGLMR